MRENKEGLSGSPIKLDIMSSGAPKHVETLAEIYFVGN